MNSGNGIGQLIRQLRKSKAMTQIGLAGKMGITYQQVQKYEYGISEFTLRRLRQIADALDVPISTFIEECDDCPHRKMAVYTKVREGTKKLS